MILLAYEDWRRAWQHRIAHKCGTRVVVLIVGLCASLGCSNDGNGNSMGVSDPAGPRQRLEFDISEPAKLLRQIGGARLRNYVADRVSGVSLDGPVDVRLVGKNEFFTLSSELIAADRYGETQYSITVSGMPCSWLDAIEAAQRICALAGLPDDTLVTWSKSEEAHRRSRDTFLVVGPSPAGKQALEIRPSFDTKRPWRVIYSETFELETGVWDRTD